MAVHKRSVSIAGHATSFSLEDEFWVALQELAKAQKCSVASLIKRIDQERSADANLSSAVRTVILKAARDGALAELRFD